MKHNLLIVYFFGGQQITEKNVFRSCGCLYRKSS